MKAKSDNLFILIAAASFAALLFLFYLLAGANYQENSDHSLDREEAGNQAGIDEAFAPASSLYEAEKESLKAVRRISGSDHVRGGGQDSKIDIIVYGDFDCPFSAGFFDVSKRIANEYGDAARIAYRYFPQRQHDNSFGAANAAECASEQGMFWEMHDKLFLLKQGGKLNEENYYLAARDSGLDEEEFQNCLESGRYLEDIQAQAREAGSFGVIGTPAIFVNGEVLPGAIPFEDFVDSTGRKREGMKSVIERYLK